MSQTSPVESASRKRRIGRFIAQTALLLLILLTMPVVAHLFFLEASFNQFTLQKLEIRKGLATVETYADTVQSVMSSGLNVICNVFKTSLALPSYNDDRALLTYLFRQVPPFAVVYPTEGFYYWRLNLAGQEVRGNFRLAELDNGRLSFVYYRHPEKQNDPLDTKTLTVDSKLGLQVSKINDHFYDVSLNGKTVRFKLTDVGQQPPRRMRLHPDESFVAQVYDESGVRFFIVRNRSNYAYYYFLNDEIGETEGYNKTAKGLWVGKRTGFLYYNDDEYDRRLLMGTDLDEGVRNTYFDGPGDQVPFRLELDDTFRYSYPAAYIKGGINKHGVFQGNDVWSRHVIGPFHAYATFAEMDNRFESCAQLANGPDKWTCLTKEWWSNEHFLVKTYARLLREGKNLDLFFPTKKLKEEMLQKIAEDEKPARKARGKLPISRASNKN